MILFVALYEVAKKIRVSTFILLVPVVVSFRVNNANWGLISLIGWLEVRGVMWKKL